MKNKKLRNRIKKLRAAHFAETGESITQRTLAKELGISRVHVSDIENHKVESISYEMILKLMVIFGLESVSDLFEVVEHKQSENGANKKQDKPGQFPPYPRRKALQNAVYQG